jgi:hypothetical protein
VGLGAVGPTSQPQCLIAPDPCSSSERAHMLPYVVQGGGSGATACRTAPSPAGELRSHHMVQGSRPRCPAHRGFEEACVS